jgi:hypothetical protein
MENKEILNQIIALARKLDSSTRGKLMDELENPSLTPEEIEERKNEIKVKLDEAGKLMQECRRTLTITKYDDDGFPQKIRVNPIKSKVKLQVGDEESWSKIVEQLSTPFNKKDVLSISKTILGKSLDYSIHLKQLIKQGKLKKNGAGIATKYSFLEEKPIEKIKPASKKADKPATLFPKK